MEEWTIAELLYNPDKIAEVKQELNEKIGKGKSIDEYVLTNTLYNHLWRKKHFGCTLQFHI